MSEPARNSELVADRNGATRGYTWEPFNPNNEVSMRHGAYSPRRTDPLAAQILEQLVAQASTPGSATSYLAEASYRPALWALARTDARIQLVYEWLLDHEGDLFDATDDEGNVVNEGAVRGAALLLNRLEASALRQRRELGLTPLSRAQLGKDLAAAQVDVAQLLARIAEQDRRDREAKANRERADIDGRTDERDDDQDEGANDDDD